MSHHPLDPAMEAEVVKLEQAADSFAKAIAAHPGDADALWLRVNRLRDRILYSWSDARALVAAERRRRLDALETQHEGADHVHA